MNLSREQHAVHPKALTACWPPESAGRRCSSCHFYVASCWWLNTASMPPPAGSVDGNLGWLHSGSCLSGVPEDCRLEAILSTVLFKGQLNWWPTSKGPHFQHPWVHAGCCQEDTGLLPGVLEWSHDTPAGFPLMGDQREWVASFMTWPQKSHYLSARSE